MKARQLVLCSALAAASALLCASQAQAQPRYHASAGVRAQPIAVGWYLGFGLTGAPLVRQSGGPDQLGAGGGYSLYGGIHLHPRAALELSWTSTFHDPQEVDTIWGPDVDYLVLDSLSLGGRLYVGNIESPIAPYIHAGIGAYALSSTYFGLDSSGTGFHLGVGTEIWLAEVLALDLKVRYRGVGMGPPRERFDDTFLSILEAEIGLAFHF